MTVTGVFHTPDGMTPISRSGAAPGMRRRAIRAAEQAYIKIQTGEPCLSPGRGTSTDDNKADGNLDKQYVQIISEQCLMRRLPEAEAQAAPPEEFEVVKDKSL